MTVSQTPRFMDESLIGSEKWKSGTTAESWSKRPSKFNFNSSDGVRTDLDRRVSCEKCGRVTPSTCLETGRPLWKNNSNRGSYLCLFWFSSNFTLNESPSHQNYRNSHFCHVPLYLAEKSLGRQAPTGIKICASAGSKKA